MPCRRCGARERQSYRSYKPQRTAAPECRNLRKGRDLSLKYHFTASQAQGASELLLQTSQVAGRLALYRLQVHVAALQALYDCLGVLGAGEDVDVGVWDRKQVLHNRLNRNGVSGGEVQAGVLLHIALRTSKKAHGWGRSVGLTTCKGVRDGHGSGPEEIYHGKVNIHPRKKQRKQT